MLGIFKLPCHKYKKNMRKEQEKEDSVNLIIVHFRKKDSGKLLYAFYNYLSKINIVIY